MYRTPSTKKRSLSLSLFHFWVKGMEVQHHGPVSGLPFFPVPVQLGGGTPGFNLLVDINPSV